MKRDERMQEPNREGMAFREREHWYDNSKTCAQHITHPASWDRLGTGTWD